MPGEIKGQFLVGIFQTAHNEITLTVIMSGSHRAASDPGPMMSLNELGSFLDGELVLYEPPSSAAAFFGTFTDFSTTAA